MVNIAGPVKSQNLPFYVTGEHYQNEFTQSEKRNV